MKSKKLLLSVASCVMALTLTGCKDKTPDVPPEEPVKTTPYYLVNNGISEYKIVYPEGPQAQYMVVARNELSRFFKEATGYTLEQIPDTQASSNADDCYYLSLGYTSLLNSKISSGEITVDNKLGNSGFGIKTIGKTVYFYGTKKHVDEPVLNGVYKFLEDAFDYDTYAADETYVKETLTAKVIDYNYTYIPSFDTRELGYYDVMRDPDYEYRMKLIDRFNSTFKEWVPGFYGHSQQSLLVKFSEYYAQHPEWFVVATKYHQIHWGYDCTLSADGQSLVWGEGADLLKKTMVDKITAILTQYTDQKLISLGEEDEGVFCNCENCQKLNKALTGSAQSAAGMQIAFINRVIEDVEAWIAEKQPGRELRYVIFGYHGQTIEAPVARDAEGNITGPYHPAVVPHEKMYQQYAPIRAKYDHDFYDKVNDQYRLYIQGWNYLFPNKLTLWSYHHNYSNYLVNFNNFSAIQSQIRFFAENGVSHYFGQGSHNASTPCMVSLRIYTESKLLYDAYGNEYIDLVKDFMNHYYDDASEYMYEYYSLIKDNYVNYQQSVGDDIGSIYSTLMTSNIYPEPFVAKLREALDNALRAIEPLETANPTRFATLQNRIYKEYVSLWYITVKLYSAYFTDSQVQYMRTMFYKYASSNQITHSTEGNTITTGTL